MDLVVGATGVLSAEITQRLAEGASDMNESMAGN